MARSDEIAQLGRKRPADWDPDGAQPLTKRFGYLHIGTQDPTHHLNHNHRSYDETPTIGARPGDRNGAHLDLSTASTPSHPTITANASSMDFHVSNATGSPAGPTLSQADAMMLDDTKHTTYIHDLDRELADIEAADGALVFLPFATKMISVPESVLSNPAQGMELVVYREPSSLTVPEEHDSVRKAIIESRARARAKTKTQATNNDQSAPVLDDSLLPSSSKSAWDNCSLTSSIDDDPMEIDSSS